MLRHLETVYLIEFRRINSRENNGYSLVLGFPGGSDGKKSACSAGFDPWVAKIPWKREWQSTPVFLPGEFHGQRNLVSYGPWGLKELDTTEHISMHDGRTAMWMCLMLLTCIVPCKVLLVASWPAGFSGDTQSSVVFPSVEEYSIVCCDPHYHKP